MRRRILLAGLAALALLPGCHQLTNPVDPNSTTFTGETTLRDPEEPSSVLPEIVRWRILTEHSPGQTIGFDLPDDSSHVEPRRPPMSPLFYVIATFAERVNDGDFRDGIYLWGSTSSAGTQISQIAFDRYDPATNSLRMRIDSTPDIARARIKLVDRNGRIAGAVNFSFLAGDVNGDGVVNEDDLIIVQDLDNQIADGNAPATVRADIDASGVVEGGGAGDPDYDFVALGGFNENTLSGLSFPDF